MAIQATLQMEAARMDMAPSRPRTISRSMARSTARAIRRAIHCIVVRPPRVVGERSRRFLLPRAGALVPGGRYGPHRADGSQPPGYFPSVRRDCSDLIRVVPWNSACKGPAYALLRLTTATPAALAVVTPPRRSVVEGAPLSSAVIDARGVTVTYEPRAVLDAVDVRMGRDSRIALIGPNGSGKSTLLRVLAGPSPPGAARSTATARSATCPRWPATRAARPPAR